MLSNDNIHSTRQVWASPLQEPDNTVRQNTAKNMNGNAFNSMSDHCSTHYLNPCISVKTHEINSELSYVLHTWPENVPKRILLHTKKGTEKFTECLKCVKHCLGRTWRDHDDVIKWKYLPRYWAFVREIHRSPAISPHKGQWRGALMLSLICAWINRWVNNREAGDLRRHHAHYDVTVMHIAVHTVIVPAIFLQIQYTNYRVVSNCVLTEYDYSVQPISYATKNI